jgi:hypothetical protein
LYAIRIYPVEEDTANLGSSLRCIIAENQQLYNTISQPFYSYPAGSGFSGNAG